MKKLIIIILFFLGNSIFAQTSNPLVSSWQLEKIAYKKIFASNDGEQEQFLNIFKTGLYKQLNEEQRLDLYELEQLNKRADELLKLFYQSTIEFQDNGAFYNRSKLLDEPSSGEYLLDEKKLLMEWSTAEGNNFKILKINASELVLKDVDLMITYYYTKPKNN